MTREEEARSSLDTQRWQRAVALFEAAVEMEPERRTAFLDAACDDERVRHEVAELLANDEEAHAFLAPLVDRADRPPAPGDVEDQLRPTVVGYQLHETLGRGGMGSVYRGTRDGAAFEQAVAIKVLNVGLGSTLQRHRFRSERQILATLNHPNIARLIDGGTASDGRPFIVMEKVDGLPIDRYCNEGGPGGRALTTHERVALFLPVCDAVDLAHRNLVVHRDLKPDNILVTTDGTPKLLDFGIAKLLAPESVPWTVEPTQTGHLPMTPRYASPEQLRGEATTTATDVYSLGVVLYELLTGAHPYGIDPPTPAPALLRLMDERPPARPSTAIVTMADTPEPETAGAALQRRRRALAGDLDTILLQALHVDPTRRYASPRALADDLRRHLQGEAVLARGDALGYRLRTFARRHKAWMAAATLVALVVIGAAVALGFQAARLATERDRARRVVELMVNVFERVDPYRSRGATLTAREVLELGSRDVLGRLDDQPEVRATLATVLGRVHTALGLYREAGSFLEGEGETGRIDEAQWSSFSLERRHALGVVWARQGREREAAQLLEATLEELDATRPFLESVPVRLELASLHQQRGFYDQAQHLFLEAIPRLEGTTGSERLLADGYLRWSLLHTARGHFEEAAKKAQRGLALLEEHFGPDALETADAHARLADVHGFSGEYAEASQRYARAIELFERDLGEDHPITANARGQRALYEAYSGNLDAAAVALDHALEVQLQSLGREHPDVARTVSTQGVVAYYRGDYEGGLALVRQAIDILEPFDYPEHQGLRLMLTGNLGAMLLGLGRTQEALSYMERSVAIGAKLYEETSAILLTARRNLAAVRFEIGPVPDAMDRHQDLERVLMSMDPSTFRDQQLAAVELALGILATLGGSEEQALDYTRRALARAQANDGENSEAAAMAHFNLARAFARFGFPEEAETQARTTIRIREQLPEQQRWLLATARFRLASLLLESERRREAQSEIEEAMAILTEEIEKQPSTTALSIALANAKRLWGEIVFEDLPTAARQAWQDARALAEPRYDANRRTIMFAMTLSRIYLLLGDTEAARPLIAWLQANGVESPQLYALAEQLGISRDA